MPARSTSAAHDATALSPAERDAAFVFQQYSLYPHLSVYDNLAFPLRSPARKMPEDQIRRRVDEVAQDGAHPPQARTTARRKLSGGEMQRVAIGRALVRKPVDLSDGRAAVVARRQAARRSAARAEAHPERARRHHALCHARPDRGDDHGRPHRHPRRRRAGADRHAARDLSASRQTSMSRHGSASRRSIFCRQGCCPTAARRPEPRPSARAPSICRSTRRRTAMPTASSTGSSIWATRTTCM